MSQAAQGQVAGTVQPGLARQVTAPEQVQAAQASTAFMQPFQAGTIWLRKHCTRRYYAGNAGYDCRGTARTFI